MVDTPFELARADNGARGEFYQILGQLMPPYAVKVHAAPAAHIGTQPRFLVNKDIVVKPWW
jgi:hypothetical protein